MSTTSRARALDVDAVVPRLTDTSLLSLWSRVIPPLPLCGAESYVLSITYRGIAHTTSIHNSQYRYIRSHERL